MSINSTQSVLLGLFFGVAPGALLLIIGFSLGGEWLYNLGFVGIWLIFIGLFAGPLLGSVGPEIVAEWPAISGAIVGAIPGVIVSVMRMEGPWWINVLAIAVGSILGAIAGHWLSTRRHVHTPSQPA